MKNFSNLLDTELPMDFRLGLSTHGAPVHLVASVNNCLIFNGYFSNKIEYTTTLPLRDSVNISFTVSGKDYNADSTSAVIINHLSIDGFDLVPNWTHLSVYTNDHDYTDPTTHLGFNGEWKFDISEAFYTWRHRVLGQGWQLSPESIAK